MPSHRFSVMLSLQISTSDRQKSPTPTSLLWLPRSSSVSSLALAVTALVHVGRLPVACLLELFLPFWLVPRSTALAYWPSAFSSAYSVDLSFLARCCQPSFSTSVSLAPPMLSPLASVTPVVVSRTLSCPPSL